MQLKKLSRNQQFCERYARIYSELYRKLYVLPTSARIGGWSGSSSRRRVRALARDMARHEGSRK